ncbi:MAG: manganese efflux pump [Clostridia bacterium]|nr:manganese efflux pump [Clostridia bacterium]
MEQGMLFFVNSAMLGVGLAMDAFSVSLANGLAEPKMKGRRMLLIAGVFAVFQALMPLTGWFCVHNLAKLFVSFSVLIPWIALALLVYIGSKMLYEGIQCSRERKAAENTCGEQCPIAAGAAEDRGDRGNRAESASRKTDADACGCSGAVVGFGGLLVQGVATSIDALSVGFTIAEYDALSAVVSALIISVVTLAICLCGVAIGKKFGTKLAGKASILGGVILIAIGLEIWISGVFF